MAHTSDVRTSSQFGASVFSQIANLRDTVKKRFAQNRVYRKTLNELESLSVRELNDMGLNPHTLKSIAYDAAYGTH